MAGLRHQDHVTVALSGEGGDEFFAGYPTYRASRISNAVAPLLPAKVWSLLGLASLSMARGNQERLPAAEKIARFCLGNAAAPRSAHPQWRRQIFEPHRASLYGAGLADFAERDPMAGYAGEIEQAGERFPAAGLTDRNLLADQSYYLPGDLLAKADRISMTLDKQLADRIKASVLEGFDDQLAFTQEMVRFGSTRGAEHAGRARGRGRLVAGGQGAGIQSARNVRGQILCA